MDFRFLILTAITLNFNAMKLTKVSSNREEVCIPNKWDLRPLCLHDKVAFLIAIIKGDLFLFH